MAARKSSSKKPLNSAVKKPTSKKPVSKKVNYPLADKATLEPISFERMDAPVSESPMSTPKEATQQKKETRILLLITFLAVGSALVYIIFQKYDNVLFLVIVFFIAMLLIFQKIGDTFAED